MIKNANNVDLIPIFAFSSNRIIIVDKTDYILSYKHNIISNYHENAFNSNLDLGKLYLSPKNPSGNKIIQYISNEKIFAKNSINHNNNDNNVVKKIISILEGKSNGNEVFKLDNKDDRTKIFKIILNVKSGVSIVMFSCEVTENILNTYNDVLLTCMRYFKNKSKINEALDNEMNEKNKKSEEAIKKYTNLTRKIENEEKNLMNNLCKALNDKKAIIRRLKREIDGVQDIPLEKEENIKLLNGSFNKLNEEFNESQTLSLSDLI